VSEPLAHRDAGRALLDVYDDALPYVYGYLVTRVGTAAVAEDLTSVTFLAAVEGVGRGAIREPNVAWLLGIARHKLADHWRRVARDERQMHAVASLTEHAHDPWTAHLDAAHAHAVLAQLGAHHRSALTFRYLDGLAVAEVASLLGRSVHATEALLVRARHAFRVAYEGGHDA
jgi:RNA polymerase sigma-70 factor (ECF subfamily)